MRWDRDYVALAAARRQIVAGFNIFGHEDAGAVIRAAERLGAPVMLMVNRDARKALDIECWGALLGTMAERAAVPVAVHLDHSSDPENVRRAMASGFTSVMFDGSKMPFEENLRLTAMLAEEARARGIYLEAELGSVPYSDLGQTEIRLTSPEEARQMQEQAKPDWLAVSVGNIHRLVDRKVPIRFDALHAVQQQCSLPLIIHGSSGIYEQDMQRLKEERIGKMNLGTTLRKLFGDTLRQEMAAHPEEFDRQKLMQRSVACVEDAACEIMQGLL